MIHAYTKMALDIKSSHSDAVTFFLGYSDRAQMYHRISERVFNEKAFDIRKSYSDNEYSMVKKIDHFLESDNPNDFVNQILNVTNQYDC
ncbi:MAG: hypothetical protein D3903_22315 [Candidatus Electrothrix sp. GM3_4]|nr:hypothetical protein [Candidatus Electrothrix sp. GM3_4]